MVIGSLFFLKIFGNTKVVHNGKGSEMLCSMHSSLTIFRIFDEGFGAG